MPLGCVNPYKYDFIWFLKCIYFSMQLFQHASVVIT